MKRKIKMHGIQMKNNEKCTLNEKMHGYQNSFIFKAHSFCSGITVSFSTGSFFFFRLHSFYFSGLFSFFRSFFLFRFLLSTFYIWRTRAPLVSRAPWCHEHLIQCHFPAGSGNCTVTTSGWSRRCFARRRLGPHSIAGRCTKSPCRPKASPVLAAFCSS